MLIKLKHLFLLNFLLIQADGSKVLVIPPKDSGSHLASIIEYVLFLCDKGHQVHLFDTAFETPKYRHPNLTTLSAYVPINETTGFNPWKIVGNDIRRFGQTHKRKDVHFQEIIRDHRERIDLVMGIKWDLIIVDIEFNPHGYSIAMRLKDEQNIPYILIETSGITAAYKAINLGMGRNPIIRPHTTPRASKNSKNIYNPHRFADRIYNVAMATFEIFIYELFVQNRYMPTIKSFGVDFSWKILINNAEFMFSHAKKGFNFPSTGVSHLIKIGEKCPIARKLSGEIFDFIEDSTSKGTIYIAFGTYANWEAAPENIIHAFTEAMRRLRNYRIVFIQNANSTNMPSLPNVLYLKWTDQVALLSHPKNRLFITHGGWKSVKEGICSETPLLFVPLFAEQTHNAQLAVSNNYGRIVNKFTLEADSFYTTIKEMLDDYSNWKLRMKRVKSLYLDSPIDALDLALHYTERAIKSKRVFFKPKIDSWIVYLYGQLSSIILVTVLLIK